MSILDEEYDIDERNDMAMCDKMYEQSQKFFMYCDQKYNFTWSNHYKQQLKSGEIIDLKCPNYLLLQEINELKEHIKLLSNEINSKTIEIIQLKYIIQEINEHPR